jgi:hypothetical protein
MLYSLKTLQMTTLIGICLGWLFAWYFLHSSYNSAVQTLLYEEWRKYNANNQPKQIPNKFICKVFKLYKFRSYPI